MISSVVGEHSHLILGKSFEEIPGEGEMRRISVLRRYQEKER